MADASASQEFLQSLCDSHLVCAPVQGQQLQWQTSPKLCLAGEQFSPAAFLQINELLLANPNFNSSHVFRADILCDSAGQLQSPAQAEAASLSSSVRATNGCQTADVDADANADSNSATDLDDAATHVRPLDPFEFAGLTLSRTVVRRFIPRKQKLDRALNQTCDFYESRNEPGPGPGSEPQALQSLPPVRTDYLVVLRPHVSVPSQMPWYHPAIQAVAFLYRYSEAARSETSPEGNL
ncbi:tRNA(Ser) Um(44) 2'-O-methyltransferase, partial [Ascosphaera acerosa]